MSNIKALEDLRVYANGWRNGFGGHPSDVETLADRIECEIAQRFIELPCDADGVPIHVGDVIQFVNDAGGTGAGVEVCAVSNYYAYYGEGKHFYRAKNTRHYKPRTVEDVLEEYADMPERIDRIAAVNRYADEIRELMGVSE